MAAILSPITAYHGADAQAWVRLRNREFDRVRFTSEEGSPNLPRWAAHSYRWEPGDRGQPMRLAERAIFVGDDAFEVRVAALDWCAGLERVDRFLFENRFDLQARGCIV